MKKSKSILFSKGTILLVSLFIMEYKILKWLGFLPFIAIVSIGLFSSIAGFSFMFSTSYGIVAFFESILIIFCSFGRYI